MLLKTTVSFAAAFALASTAFSQVITMTHEGIASGSLGGTSFGLTPFTITCTADVNARLPLPGGNGFSIDHATASIDITGVGVVSFTTETRSFVNSGGMIVGFSRGGTSGSDLFNGPADPQLASWDMLVPIGPLSGTGTVLQWDDTLVLTSGGVLDLLDSSDDPCTFSAVLGTPTIGTPYCTVVPNSTGQLATLIGQGSDVVSMNDVTLRASELPTGSFGIFLASQASGFSPNPGGSAGNLCLGGSIGRYVGAGQIQNSGAAGAISLALDLSMTPQPNGLVSVQAGEVWYFQAWFRDVDQGQPSSNFTAGLEIPFQ